MQNVGVVEMIFPFSDNFLITLFLHETFREKIFVIALHMQRIDSENDSLQILTNTLHNKIHNPILRIPPWIKNLGQDSPELLGLCPAMLESLV